MLLISILQTKSVLITDKLTFTSDSSVGGISDNNVVDETNMVDKINTGTSQFRTRFFTSRAILAFMANFQYSSNFQFFGLKMSCLDSNNSI